MCVYVCMYVCMYVCVYACMYVYVCMYVYMHVCMYVCMADLVCTHKYTHSSIYHKYTYTHVNTHTYIHVHTHTHILNLFNSKGSHDNCGSTARIPVLGLADTGAAPSPTTALGSDTVPHSAANSPPMPDQYPNSAC